MTSNLPIILARQAARYRTTLTELQVDVYLEDLAQFDDSTVLAAFAWHAQSGSSYFPTMPELFAAIRQCGRASGQALDGASAWAAFTSRVLGHYSFGVSKSFDWPDELTRTIVREQLGFDSAAVHNLAMIESDFEREKFRKLFIQRYNDQGTFEAVRASVEVAPVLASGKEICYNTTSQIESFGGASNTPKRDTEGVSNRA